ncbi:MAG: dephospho-CoA kinase, partial [Verrucomicrobiae bacterium]|nr:dephospho-CoA kinase [Verrucomicrobiae bacterium]NNJ85584.1 dephospho-CoA kinase [Akkermansiaceae bacterium]
ILGEMNPDTVTFDADDCVRKLYTQTDVVTELVDYFGSGMLDGQGQVDKVFLRTKAFSNPEDKQFLEQVFHPRVRKECLALLDETAKNPSSRLFVADIPLLFENGFDFGQSANLLVATSRQTQTDRLKQRNNWDDKTVVAVLSSQMSIDAKLTLADVVFWNEGPEEMLRNQCRRFLRSIDA